MIKKQFKSKKEFEVYRDICFTIWGAMPIDVKWAMQTKIYQNAKIKAK